MISVNTLNECMEGYYSLVEDFEGTDEQEILEVSALDKEIFDHLYDSRCLTWEGLSYNDFDEAIRACGTHRSKYYLIFGQTMNSYYGLSGKNAYPNDLNIFIIENPHGLSTTYNGRWFKDVVDTNGENKSWLT